MLKEDSCAPGKSWAGKHAKKSTDGVQAGNHDAVDAHVRAEQWRHWVGAADRWLAAGEVFQLVQRKPVRLRENPRLAPRRGTRPNARRIFPFAEDALRLDLALAPTLETSGYSVYVRSM